MPLESTCAVRGPSPECACCHGRHADIGHAKLHVLHTVIEEWSALYMVAERAGVCPHSHTSDYRTIGTEHTGGLPYNTNNSAQYTCLDNVPLLN